MDLDEGGILGGGVDLTTLGLRVFLDIDLDGEGVSRGDSCGESKEDMSIMPDFPPRRDQSCRLQRLTNDGLDKQSKVTSDVATMHAGPTVEGASYAAIHLGN